MATAAATAEASPTWEYRRLFEFMVNHANALNDGFFSISPCFIVLQLFLDVFFLLE